MHKNKYLQEEEEWYKQNPDGIMFDGAYAFPVSSQCSACAHYHGLDWEFTCDAFPDGIPPELWWATRSHEKPYPGDHGIQFEKK